MWCCLNGEWAGKGDHRIRLEGPESCVAYHPKSSISWGGLGELPHAAIAYVLNCLSFQERCVASAVCSQWYAIVNSAAAHCALQQTKQVHQAGDISKWALTRAAACDVEALDDVHQRILQQCRALRHVPSATVWLCSTAKDTLKQLVGATRLQLLDTRCDMQCQRLIPPGPLSINLSNLRQLRVLNVGMTGPAVDFTQLPASLQCLHLNLASGCSVSLLSETCTALAEAAQQLPHLQHVSLGLELDALISNSKGLVLGPVAALKQLTSLAFTDYQQCHPESPAHEGYNVVPPVLQQLPNLQQVELKVCSGHHAQLAAAAAIPDVRLVLTLARHEQAPFNRLPNSLTLLTGLKSLSILMAEFEYDASSDLYVFDASPLAQCSQLHTLLLELHGSKAQQHDLRGLAELHALQDLVVLLKCPDLHEARPFKDSYGPLAADSHPSTTCDSSSGDTGSVAAFGGWLKSTAASLLKPWHKGMEAAAAAAADASNQLLGHARNHGGSGSSNHTSNAGPTVQMPEEWVLQLLDAALDQLRPEFALSVPHVSGRLLVATTSRLLLRRPELLTAAQEPLLLASHLQLDRESAGDCWGGECFLQRLSPRALRAWVDRNWQPGGVQLLLPARYPQLGIYPGCKQRIDDKLLIASREGVAGYKVIQALMAVVEERCMAYFN